MVRTLPSGVISLDTAVDRIARNGNLYPAIVYRDEADAAWRKLCALPEGVRPLMLTSDGVIQKVARTQFIGFADKYWKFASILRYPRNGEGVPRKVNEHCPSHDLLDESGRVHPRARLVFLESEIEAAFGMAAEPGAAPDVPHKRLPVARRELESFLLDFDRKQEIAGGSRSEATAWAAAKERFHENAVPRTMVRNARKAIGCLGKPGKKPNHAAGK